ncbi:MAG TPA: zinc ribbon domain-containing protein [Nitrososphaerales archaeon]
MAYCKACGKALPDDAKFCPSCGTKIDLQSKPLGSAEQVLGTVLFGGYYRDICFTDRRVIQFETMRDRWKYLVKVTMKPPPLVLDRDSKIDDVLPFLKLEIPRGQIRRIELKDHSRLGRGHFRIVRITGETTELARIDVDVPRELFKQLTNMVREAYPEIPIES